MDSFVPLQPGGADVSDLAPIVQSQAAEALGQGTGLGLAQVKALASQIGGRVEMDSSVGHGTTVSIWLTSGPAVSGIASALVPAPILAVAPSGAVRNER